MAKIVDITDKLSFDENPKVKIKDVELEVNSDATSMLKLMGALSTKNEAEATLYAYELLFSEADRVIIDAMKLQFKDFKTLIESCINLVTAEEGGEQ